MSSKTVRQSKEAKSASAFAARVRVAEQAAADPRWCEIYKLKVYTLEELARFARERGVTVSPKATGKISIPTKPDRVAGKYAKKGY